jgi:DNA repair exonuclease SbcCD ATPase subunit
MDHADPQQPDTRTPLLEQAEANLRRVNAQLDRMDERHRQWEAQAAARAQRQPDQTTLADLQHWLGRDQYPTWIHAAYADLASRLARVDERLETLEASMGLLHTKMEMIIGQLAAQERREDTL